MNLTAVLLRTIMPIQPVIRLRHGSLPRILFGPREALTHHNHEPHIAGCRGEAEKCDAVRAR